jgi:hypothetical protein
VDRIRSTRGSQTISELDGAERFSPALHTRGDIASPLIFTASYADFLAIDRSRFDVAAVTGNSMGWYTTLAVAGAVSAQHGFEIVDAMARTARRAGPAGRSSHARRRRLAEDAGLREQVLALAGDHRLAPRHALYLSIELGGCRLRRHEPGLAASRKRPPTRPRPARLRQSRPFHTPSCKARPTALSSFPPNGSARPGADDRRARPCLAAVRERPAALHDYTFVHQILRTYDFTRAVQVAVREYSPDRIILLGPGRHARRRHRPGADRDPVARPALEARLPGDAGGRSVPDLDGPGGPAGAGIE